MTRKFDHTLNTLERADTRYMAEFISETGTPVTGTLGVVLSRPLSRSLVNRRVYSLVHYFGGGTVDVRGTIRFLTGQTVLVDIPFGFSNDATKNAVVNFSAAGDIPSVNSLYINFPDIARAFLLAPNDVQAAADEVQVILSENVQSVAGIKIFLGVLSGS